MNYAAQDVELYEKTEAVNNGGYTFFTTPMLPKGKKTELSKLLVS